MFLFLNIVVYGIVYGIVGGTMYRRFLYIEKVIMLIFASSDVWL